MWHEVCLRAALQGGKGAACFVVGWPFDLLGEKLRVLVGVKCCCEVVFGGDVCSGTVQLLSRSGEPGVVYYYVALSTSGLTLSWVGSGKLG